MCLIESVAVDIVLNVTQPALCLKRLLERSPPSRSKANLFPQEHGFDMVSTVAFQLQRSNTAQSDTHSQYEAAVLVHANHICGFWIWVRPFVKI